MSTANNYMGLINTFQRKVTADLIAEYLRDRILDGTFAPATSINEVHLAAQLEISRSPVREAVQRLVQEGLLVSTRNRGTSVVELGPEDIEDVYLARAAIEREAARLVLRGDTTGLTARLDAVLGDMSRALENDKWHDVATADVTFHQTIVQAAGSPRLERMFSTLAAETLLCVRQFQYVVERKEAILAQHRRLRDLIGARDEQAYLTEIERHLKNSNATLEAARQQRESLSQHQGAEGPAGSPAGRGAWRRCSRAGRRPSMITTIEPGRYFHVTGQTPGQIEDDINTAVKKARAHADQEPWLGILVTRHSPEVYTVALSALVPYGQTFERDDGFLPTAGVSRH